MKLLKFLPRLKRFKLFLLRKVVGDSMAPTLLPGAIVLGVWPVRLREGDVVVVSHDNLDKIKRVESISPGQVFLVGDNPGSSTDSRSFGWLERKVVMAKVVWHT